MTETATLNNPDTADAYFGYSVSASSDGNYAAVGRPGIIGATGGAGEVFVYVKAQGNPQKWSDVADLTPSDAGAILVTPYLSVETRS